MEKELYCSLDIETSGFDPLANEILEVGFVFFELEKNGLRITEEWKQVFKPSKPVDPKIFGLTGIKPEDLENAPKFSEFHEFLQNKLGQAVIVGHNIIFDIKFLEAFGIKFSGKSIDTLELVQWILPTHHSYNLENLTHYFKVEHKEAHRALADAKACLTVLEKLLGVFHSFPVSLKLQIKELVKNRFSWSDLLEAKLPAVKFSKIPHQSHKAISGIKLETGGIYDFSLGQTDSAVQSALFLKSLKGKSVITVPTAAKVLELWKLGCAKPQFRPEALFSEDRFNVLLAKAGLTDDELKFCLKVLVWKHTNWQTQCLLDLNLSFFGGQFRSVICQGELESSQSSAKIIACDMATFCQTSSQKNFKGRFAVICGLVEFEQQVSANISERAGSGHINYILRSYFNPELNSGEERFKILVIDCLQKSDLFFGLVGALLKTGDSDYESVKVDEVLENSQQFNKLKNAADHYVEYLQNANNIFRSNEIERFTNNLLSFFNIVENRIRWVELSDKRCTFFSSPIKINDLVKNVLQSFTNFCFVDAIGHFGVLEYVQTRLGLLDMEIRIIPEIKNRGLQALLPFSGLGNYSISGKKIQCVCKERLLTDQEMLAAVSADRLPAAIVFGGSQQLRAFYEQYYGKLKDYCFLAAQNGSGGANKLLRNFSINENSLLLATDKFLLKAVNNFTALEPIETLRVKTLIICRLPFELFTHPYQEAVAQLFENPFQQYSLPRAVYNLHCLLKLFDSQLLEQIYICDSKLSKSYANAFKEYLAARKNFEVII